MGAAPPSAMEEIMQNAVDAKEGIIRVRAPVRRPPCEGAPAACCWGAWRCAWQGAWRI